MNPLVRNAVMIVGAIAISFVYLWLSLAFVPPAVAPIVNLIIMPLLLGALAAHLLTGHLLLKLALLFLVPAAHVLALGQDEAKPGLGYLVAIAEMVVLWIGCLIAHLLIKRKARSADSSSTA